MQEEEGVHIFLIKGSALEVCMKETWYGPNPGWMQYDAGVEIDSDGNIVSIGGKALDLDKIYRVGSMSDFKNDHGNQPTFHEYFTSNPESLPDWDAGIGCDALLLKLFSNLRALNKCAMNQILVCFALPAFYVLF